MMVTSKAFKKLLKPVRICLRDIRTMTYYVLNKLGILTMTIKVIDPVMLGTMIEEHQNIMIFRIEENTEFPELSTGAYRHYVNYFDEDGDQCSDSIGSLLDHKIGSWHDDKYHKTHPTASNDPLLEEFWYSNDTNDWYFGFDSVRQLKKWFHMKQARELNVMNTFRIAVYTAHEGIKRGKYQAIFESSGARFHGVLDINKVIEGKYSPSSIKAQTNKKAKEQK